MLSTFLRKVGIMSPRTFTQAEVEAAETDNALWENEQAFKKVAETYKEGSSKVNSKLKKAAERVRGGNPFAELEDLTNLRRDTRR